MNTEIEEWKNEPGWAKHRRERFAKLFGRRALQANDAFLSGKAEQPKRATRNTGVKLSREEQIEKDLETSYRIMEQIRDRVDTIIEEHSWSSPLRVRWADGTSQTDALEILERLEREFPGGGGDNGVESKFGDVVSLKNNNNNIKSAAAAAESLQDNSSTTLESRKNTNIIVAVLLEMWCVL